MKKTLTAILFLLISLCLASCSNNNSIKTSYISRNINNNNYKDIFSFTYDFDFINYHDVGSGDDSYSIADGGVFTFKCVNNSSYNYTDNDLVCTFTIVCTINYNDGLDEENAKTTYFTYTFTTDSTCGFEKEETVSLTENMRYPSYPQYTVTVSGSYKVVQTHIVIS